MKSNLLIFFWVIALVLSNYTGSAQTKTANDDAKTMLRQFYTSYIIEGSNMDSNEGKLNSIKKQYCTKKILNKIQQDEELDDDPFLNAQDVDSDWLKTLTISKDPQKANVYVVSYLSNYDKKRIIIKLLVVKNGQNYKIDDILTYW